MVLHGVTIPEDALAEFCRRNGIGRMWLFGSILREDFSPESDVDLLVEFMPGRTPGMFGYGALIIELGEMIGRCVDLRTNFDIAPKLHPYIMRTARVLHAA